MSKPKITIIINSYNYERYVRQAIQSAVDQDYANKEIIVVDDGSTDSSREIILAFGKAIKPIFHKNLGQARTCLQALKHATGDFIHILDSDDYLLPGALSAIAVLCEPYVAKIQFQLQPVGPQGEIVGEPWPAMTDNSSEELLKLVERSGTYVTPPNSGNVYRADIFKYINDIDYEKSIDGVTYLLAPLLGAVRQIAQPLGCYRYHSENNSGHGTLSAARFGREAQRHKDRLEHLTVIATQYDLADLHIHDPSEHSFVHTRNMLAKMSDGKRPGIGLYLKYLRSLIREREPPVRVLQFMLWGAAANLFPDRIRKRLALYRSDPRSRRVSFFSNRTPVVRAHSAQP